jgi:hypothetical protein
MRCAFPTRPKLSALRKLVPGAVSLHSLRGHHGCHSSRLRPIRRQWPQTRPRARRHLGTKPRSESPPPDKLVKSTRPSLASFKCYIITSMVQGPGPPWQPLPGPGWWVSRRARSRSSPGSPGWSPSVDEEGPVQENAPLPDRPVPRARGDPVFPGSSATSPFRALLLLLCQ